MTIEFRWTMLGTMSEEPPKLSYERRPRVKVIQSKQTRQGEVTTRHLLMFVVRAFGVVTAGLTAWAFFLQFSAWLIVLGIFVTMAIFSVAMIYND